MIKRIVTLILGLLPIALFAQKKIEQPFLKFDNWQEVLRAAKNQNKKIFVDAFTTWCGPCKQMDHEVYSEQSVSGYLDSNFIAIKVQMDQTPKDPADIQKWYEDAKMLMDKYNILSFPSFIFLDPQGQLIGVSKGFQPSREFRATLVAASDPQKAYYSNIAGYKAGTIQSSQLLDLALKAIAYKDDSIAMEIARRYKKDYLDQQKIKDILNPGLISLVGNFGPVLSLQDPIVKFCYKNPKMTDSLLQRKGVSRLILDFYINRDLVQPAIEKYLHSIPPAGPNWVEIEALVTKRYDKNTAKRVTIDQQISYYRNQEDWNNVAKYEIEKIDMFGLDTAGMGKTAINNLVYDVIFQHVDNPVYLQKAIRYMEAILTLEPDRDAWVDTYANILYKSGRKQQALQYQEKALTIARNRNYESRIKEYAETIKRMQANQPTWTTDRP